MAVTNEQTQPVQRKSLKMPLILGVVLALAGSGGAFYAARAGLLPWGDSMLQLQPSGPDTAVEDTAGTQQDVAFVPVPPLVISLGNAGAQRHLRFRAQLEVPEGGEAAVEHLMPRVLDVLNGYLRAVAISDLEERTALMRLRTQMLRRVQIVTGRNAVSDLLIMEFVLN